MSKVRAYISVSVDGYVAGPNETMGIVPIVLGGSARLFDGVGPDVKLELVRVIDAPRVTHLKYRVSKAGA
jgi:hypothetical protein